MGFNPKFTPLDSGSGAGMAVMQRYPFAGKTEEVECWRGMGPRIREDKGGGEGDGGRAAMVGGGLAQGQQDSLLRSE